MSDAALEQLSPEMRRLAQQVRGIAGEAYQGIIEDARDLTIRIDRAAIVEVCTALRDDPALRFNMLVDLTSLDMSAMHPGREPRFEVLYQLMTVPGGRRLFLSASVPSDDAEIASVTGIWAVAGFLEREVFDLMGIRFTGHPDLRRLLLPEDWREHPLRKEYPLRGHNRP